MDSSVRPGTATSGRTLLALFAALSLVLSLFAVARPVQADHGDTHINQPTPIEWDDAAYNDTGDPLGDCGPEDMAMIDEGEVLWHFILAPAGDTLPDSATLTAIFENAGEVTATSEPDGNGALSFSVITGADTLLDAYVDTDLGQLVLSHICDKVVLEGKIVFAKEDQDQQPLAGASFEIRDSTGAVVADLDNAGALVCVDELPFGDYTVVETDAPFGYAKDETVRSATVDEIAECGENETPQFTFTNVQQLGSIVVHKVDADTDALLPGAVFDVTGPVNGTMTEGPGGVHCIDALPFGAYTVTETTPPANYHGDPDGPETVTVSSESTCDDAGRLDAPDEIFENQEMLGSVLVHKTDADTGALVSGAVFTIALDGSTEPGVALTEVADGVHCIDGLSFGDYVVTESVEPPDYLPADPDFQDITVSTESTCDATRIAGAADLVFENEAEEAPSGSITVNKELEECLACEAFTPGYWFNRGGGGGVDWADEWLTANPQTIAGIGTFASVEDVQEYLDADRSGADGQIGLSMTGQLLRHYLALVLNVAFAEANDCDLGSLEYQGTDVDTWLAMALDALESDASDSEKEEIKDALDAINNSDAGDGTLECPSEGTNGSVASFTFKLWVEDDETGELVLVDEMTTGDAGSVTFSGLELGVEYTITEEGPEHLECEIVSAWLGETELDVVDGMITVTLTEGDGQDVTITVVNDCEDVQEEEEFGDIEIIKEADDDPEASFAFSASWTGDREDFDLTDGQLWPSGDLEAGTVVTVTETLTTEQLLAGWSLDDIDCGGAEVTVVGSSVTITVVANATITCTFTNELDEQEEEGVLEIDKVFCITSGEADTEFFVFDPVVAGPIGTQSVIEDEQPDEGCWTEDVAFTITGGELTEPMHVTTGDDGILELVLPASETAYLLTEDLSGESEEFWIEDGAVTVVLVINWIPQEADNGTVKVIKLFCETDDAAEAGVTFQVEGEDVAVPVLEGCTVGDATFQFGDDTFSVGADGLAIFTAEVGSYEFAETAPNAAVYDGTVPVVEGEFTTVIVFNTFVEDELAGGGGGNSGTAPQQGQTPRGGTLGGNPLPNTATSPNPTGSVPAALLALLMLSGLGAAGYAMQVEARRRR